MPKINESLRLSPKTIRDVQGLCERLNMEKSQFYREAIEEKIGGVSPAEMMAEIENLRDEVAALRGELAKATKAILVLVGSKKDLSREDAESWVSGNLGGRR